MPFPLKFSFNLSALDLRNACATHVSKSNFPFVSILGVFIRDSVAVSEVDRLLKYLIMLEIISMANKKMNPHLIAFQRITFQFCINSNDFWFWKL